ncbi:MAG: D-alanyl-D-alanine carboxypeptidase family protein [bacterium]|jgi:D-alanyl-D-alanine carboxypeptidase (penicillin-binding protein 5/6)
MEKKREKRIVAATIVAALLLTVTAPASAAPVVNTRAAILMDAATGMIIYQENAFARLPPASTTKIMTAVLALENGDMGAQVTTSRRAANTEGSSIWLQEGETLTLQEMLYGMLLKSGNDASVAIAEHVAGQESEFVRRMNRRAREIGAFNTCFVNPNGLPAPGHYSTAYDLAVIARHALRDPRFAAIVKTEETHISWPGQPWERRLRTTNKLLTLFEGADGVKTGTTSEAGQCLVASATRANQQLIAVLLHSSNRWQDAVALLEYGFNRFCLLTAAEKGEMIATVPVKGGRLGAARLFAGDTLQALIPAAEKDAVRQIMDIPKEIRAPVRAGQAIGSIKLMQGKEILAEAVLLAGDAVGKKSFFRQICDCCFSSR